MFTLSWSLLIKISRGTGVGIPLLVYAAPKARFLRCVGLCSVWFGSGYGFRRNFRPVGTYLSFQCQMGKAGTKS